MMPRDPRRTSAALLATVALTACGGARGPVETAAAPDLDAIARARADSVRHPYTEADIRFMSGMISHHAQAIVMAGWAPGHGAGPSVRILSERIVNAQQDEILTLQTWLRDRRQPVPEASARGMRMTVNGVAHDMLMPGMLSEAQMAELDRARRPEFDRLFLTFMIQHHRGAVTMVEELFESYGAGQDELVFKLASDINVDQITEIARMETMLAAFPAERRFP